MLRGLQFLYLGWRAFTKRGYQAAVSEASETWKKSLDVDLSNKVAMVTGASCGIGFEATKALLQRGATVHMVCRSLDQGRNAQNALIAELQITPDQAQLHIVDMSDTAAVKTFGHLFARKYRLDILVNNAGSMLREYKTTQFGCEYNFAVNTLGTYVLTAELLSSLHRSLDARVIVVSASRMLTEDLEIDDLQSSKLRNRSKFDTSSFYAKHKRQQVCMTEFWAREELEYLLQLSQELDETYENIETREFCETASPIMFQSVNPGWTDTATFQHSMPCFYNAFKDSLRDSSEGADTVIWLCCSDEARSFDSGLFFLDRQPQDKHLVGTYSQYSQNDVAKLMKKLRDLHERVLISRHDLEHFEYLTHHKSR